MLRSVLARMVFIFAISSCVLAAAPYNYCQANIGPSMKRAVAEAPADGQLVLLQVLVRHGDRTPLTVLPNDTQEWYCTLNEVSLFEDSVSANVSPFRMYRKVFGMGETLKGNCSFGQLTSIGSQQHIQLGSFFRKVYVDQYGFLSPNLNTSEVYVRSTDVYRTQQSAQSELNGFFPPTAPLSGSLPAIPIVTYDTTVDYLTPNTKICPRLAVVQNELQQQPAYKQYLQDVAPVKAALQKVFNTTDIPGLSGILDALRARRCHGFAWPEGISDELFSTLEKYENWVWSYMSQGPEVSRLGMGLFVKEIYENMQAAMTGRPGPKFRLYSGHDSSITPFLNALRVNDEQWPPYASHVVMELWKMANGSFSVRFIYNSALLQLPGCSSTMCPWSEFASSVSDVIPQNYAQECRV